MGYLITRQDAQYFGAKSLQLNLKLYSSLALSDVRIHGFHSTNTFSFPLNSTTADYVVSETDHFISDFPRDLVVFVNDATTVQRGQLYAILSLKVEGQIVSNLANGYVVNGVPLNLGTHEAGNSGSGYHEYLNTPVNADIAVDEEFNLVPKQNQLLKVYGLHAILNHGDASSSTREFHAWFRIGSTGSATGKKAYASSTGGGSSSTSGTSDNQLAGTLRQIIDSATYQAVLPVPLWVGYGNSVESYTSNLASNDEWSDINWIVESWINVETD